MKLENVLNNVNYKIANQSEEILHKVQTKEVNSLEFDSRKVNDESIFIALVRDSIDGHNYINSAIDNGCKIFLIEHEVDYDDECIYLLVADANIAFAIMAANFYGDASKDLKLIGVTGTNGKTTITSLIERCLKSMNKKTGLIGTMENHILDEVYPAHNTTPFAAELQGLFRSMKEKGCEYVSMEVSSHSYSLNRIYGLEFEVGVYTNLTQDHLDFHKTMENYRDAKLGILNMAKKVILNSDTPYSEYYINNVKVEKMTYGIHNKSDIMAANVQITLAGSEFDVEYKDMKEHVNIKTPGDFSVYNALATIGALVYLGYDFIEICKTISTLDGVTGRFQTFVSKKGFSVVVDYAHTPDGLLNILETAKKFVKGNIITVFGCGGDRDAKKRPIMGEIATANSNFAVITSDNPRTENPDAIIDDVEVGAKRSGEKYIRITDRRTATKYAIDMAKEGDLVILAGKGHEDYQIIGHEKIHYSDIEIVNELI